MLQSKPSRTVKKNSVKLEETHELGDEVYLGDNADTNKSTAIHLKKKRSLPQPFSKNTDTETLNQENINKKALFTASTSSDVIPIDNGVSKYEISSEKRHCITKESKNDVFLSPESEESISTRFNAVLITATTKNKLKSLPFTFSLHPTYINVKNKSHTLYGTHSLLPSVPRKHEKIKEEALGNNDEVFKRFDYKNLIYPTSTSPKDSPKTVKSCDGINPIQVMDILYNKEKDRINCPMNGLYTCKLDKPEVKLNISRSATTKIRKQVLKSKSMINCRSDNFETTDESEDVNSPNRNRNNDIYGKCLEKSAANEENTSLCKSKYSHKSISNDDIKDINSSAKYILSPKFKHGVGEPKKSNPVVDRQKQIKPNRVSRLSKSMYVAGNRVSTTQKDLKNYSEDNENQKRFLKNDKNNEAQIRNVKPTKSHESVKGYTKCNVKNRINETKEKTVAKTIVEGKSSSENLSINYRKDNDVMNKVPNFGSNSREISCNFNANETLKLDTSFETGANSSKDRHPNLSSCSSSKEEESNSENNPEPNIAFPSYYTDKQILRESDSNESSPIFHEPINSSPEQLEEVINVDSKKITMLKSGTLRRSPVVSSKCKNVCKTDASFCKNEEPEATATPKRKELKPLVHNLTHGNSFKNNTKEKLAKFNLGDAMTYALYGSNDLSNKANGKIADGYKKRAKKENSPQRSGGGHLEAIQTNMRQTYKPKQFNISEKSDEFSHGYNSPTGNVTEENALPNGGIETFYVPRSFANDENKCAIEKKSNNCSCASIGTQNTCLNQANHFSHYCPTNLSPNIPFSSNQFCPFQHQIPLVLTGIGVIGNVNKNFIQPEMCQNNFSRKMPSLFLSENDFQPYLYNPLPTTKNLPAIDVNYDSTSKETRFKENMLSSGEPVTMGPGTKSIKDEGKKIAAYSSSGKNMAEIIYGEQTGQYTRPQDKR
ncbi:uncharacterized protein DDB_G0286591-like [Parasteatoda tepidariorum]|uniref:uncharacterized protein DDB_G0286591-like n=1 Tax=Parasteatoda tepidariorum TaxID=114398 RepID=UPI0039BC6DF8